MRLFKFLIFSNNKQNIFCFKISQPYSFSKRKNNIAKVFYPNVLIERFHRKYGKLKQKQSNNNIEKSNTKLNEILNNSEKYLKIQK